MLGLALAIFVGPAICDFLAEICFPKKPGALGSIIGGSAFFICFMIILTGLGNL